MAGDGGGSKALWRPLFRAHPMSLFALITPYSHVSKLLISGVVIASCAAAHAACIVALGRWLRRRSVAHLETYFGALWSVICIVWTLISLHLLTILLWAFVYLALGCLPDLDTAFYFSATTYTTVGYGDVILPQGWRVLAAVEALSGIFLAGLSTAFFFAVLNKALHVRLQR